MDDSTRLFIFYENKNANIYKICKCRHTEESLEKPLQITDSGERGPGGHDRGQVGVIEAGFRIAWEVGKI